MQRKDLPSERRVTAFDFPYVCIKGALNYEFHENLIAMRQAIACSTDVFRLFVTARLDWSSILTRCTLACAEKAFRTYDLKGPRAPDCVLRLEIAGKHDCSKQHAPPSGAPIHSNARRSGIRTVLLFSGNA